MNDALQITIEDHIAHVRLNRPDSHNAIDGAIMNGLLEFARQMMQPEGGDESSYCQVTARASAPAWI